jgi:hypothetical protein
MDSASGLGLGPTEDWAVDLLKTATPTQSAVGRKQRVWMGLTYATDRSVGMGGAPWFRRLVVATVLLVLGLGTAIASAALGHWPKWAVRAYETLVTSPQATAPGPVAKTPPSRYRHRAGGSHLPPAAVAEFEPDCLDDAPAAVDAEPAPVAVVPQPTSVSRVAPVAHRLVVTPRTSRRASAPTGMTVASAREDAGPVLAAVRALRRDHDPVRARALLDAYMSAHPSGGLAEEALAISIEAAAANHDADANVLASRYLRLYPTGPFHAIAQRTLGATVTAPR